MILNVSYNDQKVREKIENEVGKPFTLRERIRLGGIGSPKLVITEASIEIQNLLILDNNRDVCNIEMRPKGIILGFRSRLDSYALVIPYYKLTLYKGDFAVYSVYRDHYYVKVYADTKAIQKFFTKLLGYKADNAPTSIDDL